jgi:four helix bundle protein
MDKYSVKDRCRFLDTANASALECAAGLDILVAKRKLTTDNIRSGKDSLQKIVRMIIGLLKSSATRTYAKTNNRDAVE